MKVLFLPTLFYGGVIWLNRKNVADNKLWYANTVFKHHQVQHLTLNWNCAKSSSVFHQLILVVKYME